MKETYKTASIERKIEMCKIVEEYKNKEIEGKILFLRVYYWLSIIFLLVIVLMIFIKTYR